jgi:cyclophilin family peptidyl-prolyl cis-trans isomerase
MGLQPGDSRRNGSAVSEAIAGILEEESQARARRTRYLKMGSLVLAALVVVSLVVYAGMRRMTLGRYDTLHMETSKGLISIRVYPDLAPETVKAFEDLVGSGFYNGLSWHRVEDWVVQTGDAGSAGRAVDPNTSLPPEGTTRLRNRRGAIGVARSTVPDSKTTQFYILRADAPWLDSKFTVFGEVMSGMDVVNQIEAGDIVVSITIASKGR